MDLQEQLEILRQRVAKVNERFAPAVAPATEPRERVRIEEWMSGEVVTTSVGEHFETERLYASGKRHGSMEIARLSDLPQDLLGALSGNAVPACCPTEWAFLDTETTGLAGGTGTVAFLIGVGHITAEGFRVRHFFMRDYGEEASMLARLNEFLARFRVMVTYNGRTYDQPLLETRYRLARTRPPFAKLEHLDLLHGARRLYKLRMENCRLVTLEQQILGVERVGDLPGELIPYVYFEYLRTKQAARLVPVFHHNSIDILSLACLTGIVPYAFQEPAGENITHATDMLGLARWLQSLDRGEEALRLMRRSLGKGLPDALAFRALWDAALLAKKLEKYAESLELLEELTTCANPHRVSALEELAKHYEHRAKDWARALAWAEMLLEADPCAESQKRRDRVAGKLTKKPRLLT